MIELPLSEEYLKKLEQTPNQTDPINETAGPANGSTTEFRDEHPEGEIHTKDELNDHRAAFTDSPFRPSEKRRVPSLTVLKKLM